MAGVYSAKAEHQGFQVTEVAEVKLPVARTVTVNLVLPMGTYLNPNSGISSRWMDPEESEGSEL